MILRFASGSASPSEQSEDTDAAASLLMMLRPDDHQNICNLLAFVWQEDRYQQIHMLVCRR